jgi:activator of 2-hydroxyglutaryl-CoA dehydratase
VLVTGGLAMDRGLLDRVEALVNEGQEGTGAAVLRVMTHDDAPLAGALGAALLAAYRYLQLRRSGRLALGGAATAQAGGS